MNLQNLFKGWFTSILGCVLMTIGVYDWFWQGEEDWWRITAPLIGGFSLLYMKDEISVLIKELFTALIAKFKK
jgi:hypothetical protein